MFPFQEEITAEKSSLRDDELDQINNVIKLLNEMLNEYETKKMNTSEKETLNVILIFLNNYLLAPITI